MFCWYFTYTIGIEVDGFYCMDSAVVSSDSQFFPLDDVYCYFAEEFGDDATFLVNNVIEISAEDFKKFAETMDIFGY